MSQGNGGGPGGFGPPGERKLTTENEATQWRMVIRQALTAGWALDGIWLVLLGLGLGFWAKWGWRSFNHNIGNVWPYLMTPFLLVWLLPLGLLIWRMCAEVADPGYATPRAPVPPEYQREGPRWPGTPERWMVEDVPDEESQPTAERTVRVLVESENKQQQRIAFVPDEPEIRQFARMAANGQTFSERTAKRAKVSLDDWKDMRDTFMDRGWATWKDAKEKRQGLQLTHVGRAVLRYIGQLS